MYVYYFVQYSALGHFLYGSVFKLPKREDMTELASHHPGIVQGRLRILRWGAWNFSERGNLTGMALVWLH